MSNKKLITLCASVAAFTSHATQASPTLPLAIPASPIFCADCTGTNKLGQWGGLQQFAPGRITPVPAPDDSRGTVTQFQVLPGDNVNGSGGERAEKSQMMDSSRTPLFVLPSTPREFYALSVKLAPDWKAPDRDPLNGMWGTIFQLHGPDRFRKPPSFALCAEDRFHINLLGGDLQDPNNKVKVYEFSNGTLKPGKWVDFVIDVTWSSTTDGALTIYRRDEGDTAWQNVFSWRGGIATLQTMGSAPAEAHYWKTGFYRSPSKSTSTLWLGAVARAGTREAVEKMAFQNAR